MAIHLVYFDVAQTLLHKPAVWERILGVLREEGLAVDERRLKAHHKRLSEATDFPIQTDAAFYRRFNTDLLLALGLPAGNELPERIYQACRGLPWEPYPDTHILNRLNRPPGILSNWDYTLRDRLAAHFPGVFFDPIVISAEVGVSKPAPAFFRRALEAAGRPPAEIAFVGDSPRLDLLPAQAAGFRSFLIDRDDLFPDDPGVRLRSLEELSDHL